MAGSPPALDKAIPSGRFGSLFPGLAGPATPPPKRPSCLGLARPAGTLEDFRAPHPAPGGFGGRTPPRPGRQVNARSGGPLSGGREVPQDVVGEQIKSTRCRKTGECTQVFSTVLLVQ